MTDIAAFLLARYDEAERRAREIHTLRCDTPATLTSIDTMGRPFETACDCDTNIGRALADIAAKRETVEAWRHETRGRGVETPARTPVAGALTWVLFKLAEQFSDHDDYREEWRS